ncbi:MAG: flavodoxin family protein, partial [Lachnospiraceae bacterium]|nr:flavodoxin family protein [Lachnospiraceae bacterium]
MKVTAVYFSPTGNTKKSVEAMAAALSEQYEVLDLTAYENRAVEREFGADEFVIFGMPVYAGRIPMAAAPRLEGLTGNGTQCILVATYGNRHYDDALAEMEDIAKAHGFVVKGAAALIGRHTYGEIQVERPDAEDLKASAEFAKSV